MPPPPPVHPASRMAAPQAASQQLASSERTSLEGAILPSDADITNSLFSEAMGDAAAACAALGRAGNKRLKRLIAGAIDDSDDKSENNSDTTPSEHSWTTGSYLLHKFKNFTASLVKKRQMKAGHNGGSGSDQPATSAPARPPSDLTPVAGLKLSIIEKLGDLLEKGSENQLARIDKSLNDLHLGDEPEAS